MPEPKSSFRTIEVADLPSARGRLVFVTVKSRHLKGRGDVTLYIPDGVKPGQGIPVVILLHGVYCSHWAWAFKGRAHDSLQEMIDNEEIPPMVLAMPSDGLWGDGSGYFAHNGRDFEKWIVEDIPLLVDEVSGNGITVPHFIGGLSMGGYGAMRLGALYPDRFKAFSGHSSVTSYKDLESFIGVEDVNVGIAPETGPTILEAVLDNHDRIGPFRFDCGTEDFLIESNRKLAQDLKAAGIKFTYEEFPGGHEWPYWEEHVRRSFRFFAKSI
jgi:S-formylglutathione hydrolase FrmB